MPQVFDTIVVGAGAAGYVLSSRLSERRSHQVLLLAAGVDTPPGAERDDIADIYPTLYYNIHYMWPGLKAHWRTGHETPFPQARVMGGGGSVLGMMALRDVVADPARLKAHLLTNVAGLFHPAGTCRMGVANDPAAVVDPQGRVYGVSGLRVADAAVMPTLIAGNTHIPTLMIAEKMAVSTLT